MTALGIGIDLGTTHTALSYRELDGTQPSRGRDFPISQFVSAGTLAERTLLPSFVYFAPPAETALALPWDESRDYAVGEYARARASEVPGRVVASAKSWLSHAGVDRRDALLPLHPAEGVEKISPVEAAFRYLDHLAESWAHAPPQGAATLSDQEIVLTVPASFDAAARDLTVEAAYAAGLDNVTLLEEPQAALYGLIDALGDGWRNELRPGDVVCVVDVGGGTTDFSLIELRDEDGALEPHRIAVGDHILLGGDNMDLQLAHIASQKLAQSGTRLDRAQIASLVFGCRAAKEKLLARDAPESAAVVLPGRGSQLVGNTLRVEILRVEAEEQIVDGFFPRGDVTRHPTTRPRSGLTQQGLPYASDPAVTRHLASFLCRQVGAVKGSDGAERSFVHPTAILFNGGVFAAPRLRQRVIEVVNSWLEADGAPPVRVLPCDQLDVAVARGASYYARVRHAGGLRIRGGTAHAYYVGIDSPMPAVPGMEPPVTAVCVAPFGMEEGSPPVTLDQSFGLVVGEPVVFRFFTSTVRRQDVVGTSLDDWDPRELEEIAPVQVTLPHDDRTRGTIVPVHLRASVSAVGTLVLEAVPVIPLSEDEAWKLELNVRQ